MANRFGLIHHGPMAQLTSRIAPTPNGQLHWGNLLNFALTWAHVRKSAGKLWLRFDDMDRDRCLPRFATDAKAVLSYLGFTWDGEYADQPSHIDAYREYLKKFPTYVCDCSRKELQERTGGDLHYDGHCRDRGLAYVPMKSAIRFRSPQSPEHDFVLWRREDQPSYHLTCVHDEEALGITYVLRGEDLRESTAVQLELSKALPSDPLSKITYDHHPLLLATDGQKLSKSRGDGELLTRMKAGTTPEELWSELGTRMSKKITCLNDFLQKEFQWP